MSDKFEMCFRRKLIDVPRENDFLYFFAIWANFLPRDFRSDQRHAINYVRQTTAAINTIINRRPLFVCKMRAMRSPEWR